MNEREREVRVQARTSELMDQGVPLRQAIRQAQREIGRATETKAGS